MRIKIRTVVRAPIREVWRAWTTAEDIMRWNAASDDWCCPSAQLELKPGGGFSYRMEAKDGSMGFDFTGTFRRVQPMEAIEYVLGDGRWVQVEFIQEDGAVTVLQAFEAESTHAGQRQRDGWQAILDSFTRYVESG